MATEISSGSYTREQSELIRRTFAQGTTDDEFSLFLATAQRLGLDVFARQLFAVKRWTRAAGREVMQIQISIDGYRSIAERTGEMNGSKIEWCDEDGRWVDVWLGKGPPAAAKATIYRKGCDYPFVAVARFVDYQQTNKSGAPSGLWGTQGALMIGKCAEALALRRAFPSATAGTYAPEELDRDVSDEPPARVVDVLDRAPARQAIDESYAKALPASRDPDEVEQMIIAMRDCDTVEDLKRLGKSVASMDKRSADALRAPYAARLAEIKGRA